MWKTYSIIVSNCESKDGDRLIDIHEMVKHMQWSKAYIIQNFLLLFHRIHCSVMPIEKDKYLNDLHS